MPLPPVPSERQLLEDALLKIRGLRAEVKTLKAARREPIAIVGASCRFPGGADDLERYWRLLAAGQDAVRLVPPDRWDVDRFYAADPDAPGKAYVREGGFLEDVAGFDAEFFGVAPREAARIDPQQRLLLEVSWEALENAGIAPDLVSGTSTGVWVGVMSPDYAFRQAHDLSPEAVDPYMLSGNEMSFAAGRIAYVLGLQGPAMAVSTACSSSLVAVHLACQALRDRECDAALAGGVNVILDPITNVMLSKLRALARDGRCKTFDARADGYGRGEGCGMVVLRRLSDAQARGDRILALILGSAVNHDGPSAGLTVPNGAAQEALLRRALDVSGVDPREIGYVEAHGTGTMLGDPIELHALARVMGPGRDRPLVVGSVKTNIGHLEPAAGIAGLIKTALALHHGRVPRHLHFEVPNPHVRWSDIPIGIASDAVAFPEIGGRRIAGVSAFGLSGINAHVVLGAVPPVGHPEGAPTRHVLALSARTPEALAALVARFVVHLDAHPDLRWGDVCFTANTGRVHFAHRLAVVAASMSEGTAALRVAGPRPAPPAAADEHISAVPGGDWERGVDRLAARYLAGATVDWTAVEGTRGRLRRRVPLPTYPFQRTRHWALEPPAVRREGSSPAHTRQPVAQVDGTRLRDCLAAAPADAREGLLLDAIDAQVAVVLGRMPPIDRDVTLIDAGLDSLMAVEIAAWADRELGAALDVRFLLSGATVRTVARSMQPAAVLPAETAMVSSTPAHDRWPLSHGQQALWFIHQHAPESPAYNIGIALAIASPVDIDALSAAFEAALHRHPMLRAVVRIVDGGPVQEILPVSSFAVEQIDARGWPDEMLRAQAAESYRLPFDLARGPLLRASLFTRAADDHLLLLTIHHIACDAVSCWTLLDEVQALYTAGIEPGEVSLPPLRASYADFVAWQRARLSGDEGERLWIYWRTALAGELPVLDLPTDFARPPLQTYNGHSEPFVVPQELTGRLRALARQQGATLFATLLAAFHAWLHRYTARTDIIVGTATLGRPSAFRDVVGYFVNPVAIRADLSADPTFRTLLRQVRETTMAALDHCDFPFPLLVERLQPRRDPSRTPVFQVDFALSKPATAYRPGLAHVGGRAAGRLEITRFELPAEEGQFDLSLHVSDEDTELRAVFKYNADLFNADTVKAYGATFLTLLESIVESPDLVVSAIRLLSPAARASRIELGRGPVRTVPDICLPQMFEAQVARSPGATAVEAGSARLTYVELNRRANQLARHLQRLGVGPEILVGVCVDRSVELAVALLGVLKSGGAYVPLDPSYPADRIAFMVKDAGARVVLTTAGLADSVPASPGVPRVRLDADWSAIATEDESDLVPLQALLNLAYVIYTSGSTGRPKGAEITHRGLTNYLWWAREAYDAAGGAGAPVNTSFGFDATVTSFFLPLVSGGAILLLPERGTIEALADVLRTRRGLSLLKVTPAHLEMLEHLLGDADCAGAARAFVIGGEALRGDRLRYWQRRAPGTRLINEYGPTETVVGCCVFEADAPVHGMVPIGRPIANTSSYVLDSSREPVPAGVIGELYIGGHGVGRGYRGRPDLSTDRFVDDPFSEEAGARLYRTGDLVRWRHDGELEFIGRTDNQVKIRGYRIEPGEIERVLAEHPAVGDAVVVVRRDLAGEAGLVGYVVSRVDPAPSSGELARHVAARVPDYMVPPAIVIVPSIPLTVHGKVDQRALPAPPAAASSPVFIAPRDTLEMQMVAAWEEVLGVRPIGVRDNFFDLGGHSLMAVRLMARLAAVTGDDVPLAAILRGPTVEQLADAVRGRTAAPRHSPLVPIQPGGTHVPFFCVPGAGGNAIYLYNLARQLGPDQPFFGFQGVGFDGEAPPDTTVEQMAGHYIDALRAVQPRGPYRLGGHSLGGWVAYEMAQRLLARGEQVAVLAIIDTGAPVPGRHLDTSGWDEARWIVELGDRIGQLLNPSLKLSIERLRGLDDDGRMQYFRDALSAADLYPGDASATHLINVLTLFKAHLQVRYVLPQNPHAVRLALLRTDTPPAHAPALATDPTWGWGEVAGVDVHAVPGDHFAVLRPPHVRVLAQALAGCLAQAG